MACISKFIVTVFLSAVLGSSIAHAGSLYKWVDGQGRVSYHDRPPPEGSEYRVEQKSLGTEAKQEAGNGLEKIVEKYPVILYSVPVCGSCDLARIYLEKRKVPFTEHNLENNPVLQQKLKEKVGALSAPTILIGEKVMKGYVESILEGELDSAGYPKVELPNKASRERSQEDAPSAADSNYRSRRNY